MVENRGQKYLDPGEASRVKNHYVCAVCWGHLMSFYRVEEGKPPYVEVVCARAVDGKCSGTTFVTKAYAERRRQESQAELWEARANLREILDLPQSGKTADELIDELFGG